MNNEEELRLKLRKIEALFEGAGTTGEREAAGAALERIKAKLEQTIRMTPPLEYTFTFADRWSKTVVYGFVSTLRFIPISVRPSTTYNGNSTNPKVIC